MHTFLAYLSRRQISGVIRYGAVIGAVGAATLLRFLAPLDSAPFLLYLPLIFLLSLAYGWGAGILGVVLSDLFAAWFFLHDDGLGLTTGEVIALAQFVVVGVIMVAVCVALRRAIIENDTMIGHLERSRAMLVTAKAEAESAMQSAEEANRAKSAFLANMSHELRTPLSAVIGYSEMLEEEAEELGQASLLTDLGKIKSNAKHLLTLINDVLDLSKVEANKMDVFAEEVEIEPFIQDVAATVGALVTRKSNTLAIEISPAAGIMITDAVKLRQCLFNLVSNAAKFTENGRITLSVARVMERDQTWIVFQIRDNGIGMSPEQLARLFQRFTQADETTTRRFGGTGLGLALSRAFAQLLGGDITVESTEGQGTCFTLKVLATPAEVQPDGPAAAATLEQVGAERGDLILIVDDDASQRELMTRFLQRQGFAVVSAADGLSGLQIARSRKPHVILLDVMMPAMDGWAVLQELKSEPATAAIPVVMVSFVAEAAMGAALGAADVVPKPVDWTRLTAVLKRLESGPRTALVIDDDAEMRRMLRHGLEREGWTVDEAENGQQALTGLKLDRPAIILLDLTMPVMDGFQFLRQLRGDPDVADIPVVVLSARDLSGAERKTLDSADMLVTKGEMSIRDLSAEMHSIKHHTPVSPDVIQSEP